MSKADNSGQSYNDDIRLLMAMYDRLEYLLRDSDSVYKQLDGEVVYSSDFESHLIRNRSEIVSLTKEIRRVSLRLDVKLLDL